MHTLLSPVTPLCGPDLISSILLAIDGVPIFIPRVDGGGVAGDITVHGKPVTHRLGLVHQLRVHG